MSIINDNIFNIIAITDCEIVEGIKESKRLLFQILLVHIILCIVNGNYNFFSKELFKSLIITAAAIMFYHLFLRKIIDPKINYMMKVCDNNHNDNNKKNIDN